MTHLCHREMPHDRIVLADLKMAHAKFVLLVLQGAFHRPACECDMQDDLTRRSRTGVAEEIFFLLWIEDIARIDEPIRPPDLAVVLEPKRSAFDLPEHRAFFGIFDIHALPRLAHHGAGIAAKGFDIAIDRTRFAAWIAQPAAKVTPNFADETLAERFESRQKCGTTGVPFIEGKPGETDAVGEGVANLIESDVVLGAIDDVVGDAGFFAANGVVPAVFGEKEIAIEHGAESRVEAGIAELNSDDTVVNLAKVAALLPLHAGRFVARFGMPRIINDSDGLRIGMIADDDLLKAIAHEAGFPRRPIEELL